MPRLLERHLDFAVTVSIILIPVFGGLYATKRRDARRHMKRFADAEVCPVCDYPLACWEGDAKGSGKTDQEGVVRSDGLCDAEHSATTICPECGSGFILIPMEP